MIDSLWMFLGMEISLRGWLRNECRRGHSFENVNILKKKKKRNNNNNQNTSKEKKMKREEIMKEKRKKNKLNEEKTVWFVFKSFIIWYVYVKNPIHFKLI